MSMNIQHLPGCPKRKANLDKQNSQKILGMYEKQKEEQPKLTPTYKPNSTGDKQIRITYVLPL